MTMKPPPPIPEADGSAAGRAKAGGTAGRPAFPAAARLSLINGLVLAQDLGDLLLRRQLVQAVQPEVGQEPVGRPVDERGSGRLLAAYDLHRLFLVGLL